jgi:hypothetical protein
MEADFSGYATKAGLKCTDGRTIMPDAFKHQDSAKVPLVWQHGHTDPENVLGHALLENREDGVYAYGFFNESAKAKHTHGLVEHGDITMLSIWANDLIERAGRVLHGAIREVSLVLSGANPGALIENVTIRHSDGEETSLDDEVIIHTGLNFDFVKHAITNTSALKPDETNTGDTTNANNNNNSEETVQDIYDSMNEKQKQVLHYMVGEAMMNTGSDSTAQQSNINDETKNEKGNEMRHNIFEDEKKDKKDPPYVLSHADVQGIIADATKNGSLKESVEAFCLSHGITDIDVLFPDAVAIDKVPEFLQRRTEWVNGFLGGTRKSPFSRIKTLWADLTLDEARAKGYVTGNLKKEEFFGVAKRTTIPTTVYKKQQLDRDDIVDITDMDVVTWLKSEMRVMLDEEIARAALMGDGRDVADGDKINEGNIRPISKDHELYATTLYVNMLDANSSVQEFVDAVITNRHYYKGTGLPTMYTTESMIAKFMLLKDTLGRRIYSNLADVASELRVASIVAVEVMEDDPTLLAIFVNPTDYVMGATRGGEVSMFDDFDIDYNQYKYLIETRLCGALVRLKSAIVVREAAADHASVTPNDPTFVASTGVVTIVATTGVVYKNADTDATLSTGAQTALAVGATLNVRATAADGYFIPNTEDAYWSFTRSS